MYDQTGDEVALASARQALKEVRRWIGDREVELIVGQTNAAGIREDIDERLLHTVGVDVEIHKNIQLSIE